MSNEKPTLNEQADKQMQAEIKTALNHIQQPKKGLGAKICIDCNDPIPLARREAYNSDLCIDCKEISELRR